MIYGWKKNGDLQERASKPLKRAQKAEEMSSGEWVDKKCRERVDKSGKLGKNIADGSGGGGGGLGEQ